MICHFSLEKVVPVTHEQNIICSKTCLDGTTHEQTIVRRQLFAGHVVDSRPMERKKKTHQMINTFIFPQQLKNERDGDKHVVHATVVERFVSQAHTYRQCILYVQ